MTTTALVPLRRVRENHRAEAEVALIHEVGQTVRELGGKVGEVAAIGLANPMVTMVASIAAIGWLKEQTVMHKNWFRAESGGGEAWYWDYWKSPVPLIPDNLAGSMAGIIASSTALSGLSTAVGGLLPAVLAFLTKGKA